MRREGFKKAVSAIISVLFYCIYFFFCIFLVSLLLFIFGIEQYAVLAAPLMILAGLAYFIKKRKNSIVKELCLVPLPPKTILIITLFSIGMMFLIQSVQFVFPEEMLTGVPELKYGFISAVSIAVVSPVAEEVVFRIKILGKLSEVMPAPAAVIISSMIFAGLHGGIVWATLAFLAGIYYAVLFLRTKSAYAPIVAHITCNVTALLFNAAVQGA
jgi:hypothetical protein